MRFWELFRLLVRPGVPEPVDADRYRLVARVRIVINCILASLNILKWLMASQVPDLDRGAYGRFLVFTQPLVAMVVAASGVSYAATSSLFVACGLAGVA